MGSFQVVISGQGQRQPLTAPDSGAEGALSGTATPTECGGFSMNPCLDRVLPRDSDWGLPQLWRKRGILGFSGQGPLTHQQALEGF